jgi:hypothetical protein
MLLKIREGTEKVYAAIERFVEAALKRDDSLFTPGHTIWAPGPIEDFYSRFVEKEDYSTDNFETKLERQLAQAPADTVQLAAELIYVHLLMPRDISGGVKRRLVSTILSWSPSPAAMPDDLADALDIGLLRGGMAFRTHRFTQLRFLTEFIRYWKRLSAEERAEAFADPWRFKELLFADALAPRSGYAQREALLHLVHPHTFESIISRDHKHQIAYAQGFQQFIVDPTEDVDRRLEQVRAGLETRHGRDISFYEPEIEPLWGSVSVNPWDQFFFWARRFYEWPGFDAEERDYKLEVATNLRKSYEAVVNGSSDWLQKLKSAFGKPNNLTPWQVNDRFLKWCASESDTARAALTALWTSEEPETQGILAFQQQVPKEAYNGMLLAITSFLLLGRLDPHHYPIYRDVPFKKGFKLVGYPDPPKNIDGPQLYSYALGFLDKMMVEAKARGLSLRDRLDAQGLLWCMIKWKETSPPISEWSEREREDFTNYRGGVSTVQDSEDGLDPGDVPPSSVKKTNTMESSASFGAILEGLQKAELYVSPEVVANYLLALQSRRFAILCGISGTGKTRIALEVAKHFWKRTRTLPMEEKPEPTYTVVAVRPDWTDNRGLLGFYNPITERYQTTPFLKLILEASKEFNAAKREDRMPHPYFLILDEMNLARVEHYFSDFLSCLESGEQVHLHDDVKLEAGEKGDQEPIPRLLTLPDNLFITGTVNVDETTSMFSPKVLDRAFTIEFNAVDLMGYSGQAAGGPAEAESPLYLNMLPAAFTYSGTPDANDWREFGARLNGELQALVIQLHRLLVAYQRHFGYRVANEIARFVNLAAKQAGTSPETLWTALDIAIMQKVLPKFHGTQQELQPVLTSLLLFAIAGSSNSVYDIKQIGFVDGVLLLPRLEEETDPIPTALPRTAVKVWHMLQRLNQQGFTSFME